MAAPACRACLKGVPKSGPRRCPDCGYVFRGSGWDGIDAHWRGRHLDVCSYEQFWSTLCRAHRGSGPVWCLSCRKGIPPGGPRQCPECAQVFHGRGWAGIESHWKARHLEVMAYDEFWATLCPAHRGDRDRATGYLPLLGGRGPRRNA